MAVASRITWSSASASRMVPSTNVTSRSRRLSRSPEERSSNATTVSPARLETTAEVRADETRASRHDDAHGRQGYRPLPCVLRSEHASLRSFHSGHSAPASRAPSTPPLRSFHSGRLRSGVPLSEHASATFLPFGSLRSGVPLSEHASATFLPFGSLRSGVPLSEHASATFLTVPRLFLSPPDVGARERSRLLEAFDSNWIAPLGPARRRVRAGVRGLRRCAGRRRALERHRGAAPRAGAARCGPRRRRARAVAHVRGVGERGCLRRRAAGVRRQRPRHLERRSRIGGGGAGCPLPRRTRAAGRAHRRRPLRAVRRLGPDPRRRARRTACR